MIYVGRWMSAVELYLKSNLRRSTAHMYHAYVAGCSGDVDLYIASPTQLDCMASSGNTFETVAIGCVRLVMISTYVQCSRQFKVRQDTLLRQGSLL